MVATQLWTNCGSDAFNLAALAFLFLFQVGLGVSLPASTVLPSGAPYLIGLRRESYPVRQKGKVVSFKTSYSGAIHIGHPTPQEFRVVFDTGSGHVVLPSVACKSEACLKHRRYDLGASETGVPMNLDGSVVGPGNTSDQVTIGFGTGKVVGEFVQDQICLGTIQSIQLTSLATRRATPCVAMGTVMAIEMSKKPFDALSFDGIMGLGLRPLALSGNYSFFNMLVESGQISEPHFGVFLARGGDSDDSEIAIGGHNPRRLQGPLTWVPAAMPELGYWQVEIVAVYIDDQPLDVCQAGDCRGILDTGTTHLGIPAGYDQQVSKLLTVPSGDASDCRDASGPALTIELRNVNITLFPQDYMRQLPLADDVVFGNMGVTMTSYLTGDSPTRGASSPSLKGAGRAGDGASKFCKPKVLPVNLPRPLGPNLFLLGEPVLQRYYTVYDWSTPRIGFGAAAAALEEAPEPAEAGSNLESGDQEAVLLVQLTMFVCKMV